MLTTAAPLLLVAISAATATTVPSASSFSRKKLESFTEALLWLDHNGDRRVTLAEASAGLRALSNPVARARRSAREPAVVSPLPIDDDLCVPSTDPVAFVDCVSSRARRAAALGESPRTVLRLQTELENLYGGLDDHAPAGAAERTCDELVDSHSADCRELLHVGLCRLTCGHHAQQYFRNKGSSTVSASRRRAQTGAPEFSNVDGYARILLSSDWHLEPWYDTTGAGTVDGDVRTSRFNFADATLGTFGTCRAGTSLSAAVEPDCPTTSLHDPPLAFGRSHFEAFVAAFPDSVRTYQQNASRVETSDAGRANADADANAARGVIFMLGDGQAHGFHQPYFSLSNAQAVSTHARTLLKMTKEYFAADRVFWTPGNNDGPHSAIFVHRSRDSLEEEQQSHAESVAWADALIAEGIVTDALPRQYDFVLEPAPDCVDDIEGHLQNANTSCAAVIRAVADMRVSDGYDACDCSMEEGEGMSSSGCAVGKTTNPFETIDCACHRPIDDPEEHVRMDEGVIVPGDTALGYARWQQPQSCSAPGGDGEGCVQLIEDCPASCNDCFVPRVEVHEMGLSPSAFFRRTGYYLKQLDPNNAMGLRGGNLYVIVLNTNLGAANAQQTAALLNDLAWVQQKRGGVYLLGHHPHVMANPALVPEEYFGIVLGRFAGHVHYAASTDEWLFTQVSSISQAGETSFSVMTIGNSPEQRRSMPSQSAVGGRERLIAAVQLDRDVFSWFGGPGSANEPSLWAVSLEQQQQLEAANSEFTNSNDGNSDGHFPIFAVCVVVTFSLAGAGFTVVFRRKEPVAKGESEESIYEGADSACDHPTMEQNPI